jgi:hypothetical protein
MTNKVEDYQNFAKDQLGLGTAFSSSFVKNLQTIAAETSDYSKNTFKDGVSFFEKLRGAKSVESAIEIQSDYAKGSYAAFVAQIKKLNEFYSSLGKQPIQAVIPKD